MNNVLESGWRRLVSELTPYRRWWTVASTNDRAVGVVAGLVVAALAGAFLFGVWHVIGGWMIRGNPRAGLFGVGLAAVTGALLAGGHVVLSPRFRR